jgi:uncharacterized membrane protein
VNKNIYKQLLVISVFLISLLSGNVFLNSSEPVQETQSSQANKKKEEQKRRRNRPKRPGVA